MTIQRNPIQKGKRISDAVSILADGKSFDGWKSTSIQKSIESIANSFSMDVHDKFGELKEKWPLVPGTEIKISIGDEPVFEGSIEVVEPSYQAGSRSFIFSGRSKAGDIVDSSHIGPSEFKNISLDKLAQELVAPFGIKVLGSVEPKIIEKFAVKPNETVFEAIDRAARAQGFFFVSTRAGNIRLTRAGRLPSFSKLSEDINIKAASGRYDDSKRHSEYFVKGQTVGLPEFFGDKAAQPKGEAKDLGVTRFRPLTILAESNVDGNSAKIRAQWEASNRLAKAIRVTIGVQSWRQEDGSLWGINQITHVKSPTLGLNREMLISAVTLKKGNTGGTETEMTLLDPQAYTLAPNLNKKKGSDIMAALGANFA